MTIHSRYAQCALVLALIIVAAPSAGSQLQYGSGRNVAPAFEGWEQNPDGTYNMVFGYLNRNYEEEVDIPIGPNNTIDPGGDRGQPTHFYPRRQRFIFKVPVPNDWDKNRRVVWALTFRGRTEMAKGWLQPEWELSPGVYSENNGGGVLEEGNQAPVIEGSAAETVTLPNPLTLRISAIDDGIPKPPRRSPEAVAAAAARDAASQNPNARVRRTDGLRIRWIQYRGPGRVTFDPDSLSPVYGKPVELMTKVSFSAPGTYLLRAIASDGQLESIHAVTVTVNPGGSVQNR